MSYENEMYCSDEEEVVICGWFESFLGLLILMAAGVVLSGIGLVIKLCLF